MRGAAGEAVEIYREPVATKQIGSPLGEKKPVPGPTRPCSKALLTISEMSGQFPEFFVIGKTSAFFMNKPG